MAFMALSFGSSPVFMGTSSPRLHVVMPKPLVTCAAAKRETSGSGGGRGITQPKPISPAMQKFLGVSEIPRTAAIKKIWEYIKEHNLQFLSFCSGLLHKHSRFSLLLCLWTRSHGWFKGANPWWDVNDVGHWKVCPWAHVVRGSAAFSPCCSQLVLSNFECRKLMGSLLWLLKEGVAAHPSYYK
eukprot:Gb_09376 [translate_table: standard]